MAAQEKHYEGIGGWLLLPMLALFLTPVNSLYVFFSAELPLLSEGDWDYLTNPASSHYHPHWAPAILLEAISNAFFLVAAVVLLVLLFRRSLWFPFFMIIFIILQPVVVIVSQYLLHSIPTVKRGALMRGYFTIAWAGLSALIWVPYFLFSKRVRNTYSRSSA